LNWKSFYAPMYALRALIISMIGRIERFRRIAEDAPLGASIRPRDCDHEADERVKMKTQQEEAPGAPSPGPQQPQQPPKPEVSQRDKADAFWLGLLTFTEQERIDAYGRDRLYRAYLQYQADLRALPSKEREAQG
jgi:hypothetical protein